MTDPKTPILNARGEVIGWKIALPVEIPTTTPRMTQYGFLSRLTLEEHVGIEDAMSGSTLLRVAKQRFDAAQNVDVSLVETQQFVGLLAQMKLLAPERVPELLAPISADSPHALP